MSAYELQSMFDKIAEQTQPKGLSKEEMDATRDHLEEVFRNDPSVRLK